MKNIFKRKGRSKSSAPSPSPSTPAADGSTGSGSSSGPATGTDLALPLLSAPNIKFKYGITVLGGPSDAIVDIVFVHGLTGSSASTWLHAKSGKYWPIDFLQEDVPNARVLAFGYDADVVNFWSRASQNRLGNHASNLIGQLTQLREKTSSDDRKIIYVTHSLGGLVTQDAVCKSRNNPEEHLRKIHESTIGIIFLGTPHHGSDFAAWAELGSRVASVIKNTNVNIVSALKPDSEVLEIVQTGFHGLLRMRADEGSKIAITCFYEELLFPIIGRKVVEQHSAVLPGYHPQGIHADHVGMTRFPDKDDAGYESILGEIHRWVRQVTPMLQAPIENPVASKPLSKPLFRVPFERDEDFLGRSEIIQTLDGHFGKSCRVAINGIGGIGKSQIAIEYCYRSRDQSPSRHVVWIFCATRARFDQGYTDLARELDLPGHDDPKQDVLRLVYDWLNDEQNDWLLVLDNFDDFQMISGNKDSTDYDATSGIRRYLPKISQGRMIITTRDRRVGMRLGIKNQVNVEEMSLKETRDLFHSKLLLSQELDDQDQSEIDKLIQDLDCLPLAVTQAAAFLNECPQKPENYLKLLSENDANVQTLLDKDFDDQRREHSSSVIRTWKVSFDLICTRNKLASELLSLMSLLDRQGIPETLLLRYITDQSQNIVEALGILKHFSFIGVNRGGGRYEMHRLVQLSTHRWLYSQGALDQWKAKALFLVKNQFPYPKYENWSKCELILPHAQLVSRYELTSRESYLPRAFLLDAIANFDLGHGNYENVESNSLLAIKLAREVLEPDNDHVLGLERNLANVYLHQGKTDEAEIIFTLVLEAHKKKRGIDDLVTLCYMGELALTYGTQYRLEKAEELQTQVLSGQRKKLENDDPDILFTMNYLGWIYHKQGRFEEAEKINIQALEIRQKKLGNDHPDTFTSMSVLASIYFEQGRVSEAIELMASCLEASQRILGPRHPKTHNRERILRFWQTSGPPIDAEEETTVTPRDINRPDIEYVEERKIQPTAPV